MCCDYIMKDILYDEVTITHYLTWNIVTLMLHHNNPITREEYKSCVDSCFSAKGYPSWRHDCASLPIFSCILLLFYQGQFLQFPNQYSRIRLIFVSPRYSLRLQWMKDPWISISLEIPSTVMVCLSSPATISSACLLTFSKSVYDKSLIPHKSLAFIYLFLALIALKGYTKWSASTLHEFILPPVEPIREGGSCFESVRKALMVSWELNSEEALEMPSIRIIGNDLTNAPSRIMKEGWFAKGDLERIFRIFRIFENRIEAHRGEKLCPVVGKDEKTINVARRRVWHVGKECRITYIFHYRYIWNSDHKVHLVS